MWLVGNVLLVHMFDLVLGNLPLYEQIEASTGSRRIREAYSERFFFGHTHTGVCTYVKHPPQRIRFRHNIKHKERSLIRCGSCPQYCVREREMQPFAEFSTVDLHLIFFPGFRLQNILCFLFA